MTNNITISVITATRNCVDTLSDCLFSVARQTYPYREHIVIDGASTDGTLGLIRKHIDQISVLKSEPDTGIYDALNKGIRCATGDVIGFLHADDFFASEEVLSKVAKAMEDPAVCAVYGDLEYVARQDPSKVVRRWRSNIFNKKRLKLGWMPPHPTLYVRREWYSRIGEFDTNYRIAADYLSIFKLFSQSEFKAIYLPEVLVVMRLGGISNQSIKSIIKKSREDWMVLRSCHIGVAQTFCAIVWKNLSKLSQFFS